MDPHPPDVDIETIPVHATLPFEAIRSNPLPAAKHKLKQQQLIDFCNVYSALLKDVEDLDSDLGNKYAKEILRLVANLATSFTINLSSYGNDHDTNDEVGNKEPLVKFVSCFLRLFNRATSTSPADSLQPVQGLSGATIMDYLVALIAVKSPSAKSRLHASLDNLGQYQKLFSRLRLAQVITDILIEKKSNPSTSTGKARLRSVGLPSILFICIGPHIQQQEDGKHVRHHVVACSSEGFSDPNQKEWARSMHQKRMHYVSAEGYQQVCATERAFWMTPRLESEPNPRPEPSLHDKVPGKQREPRQRSRASPTDGAELVIRANYVPYWQTMHHWPDAVGSPYNSDMVATPAAPVHPGRIGVFNHADETSGAFDILAGFKYRARCFKCASVYLYHQDADFIRTEADMNGPHHTEPRYDEIAKGDILLGNSAENPNEPLVNGPSCAEALGHLLCSYKT